MKNLFTSKRAVVWLCICILGAAVLIITIALPTIEWAIPATGWLARKIVAFDTGETIFDVSLTMIAYAVMIALFTMGKEKKSIRVLADVATAFVAIQLIYLGVMRINPDMLATKWWPWLIAIDQISSFGMFGSIIIIDILLIQKFRRK